jgi:dihydrolipoamide dehydrogenase
MYELMVIGGGTAGLRTAMTAARTGVKTVLIEPWLLGGTCLLTGCIPTKAMLHASSLVRNTKNLQQFGVRCGKVSFDFKKLISRAKKIIDEGQAHIKSNLKKSKYKNLTIIKGKAFFINKDSVKVNNKIISAKKIIICTGSKPKIIPFKGLDKTKHLHSQDVVGLKKLPRSLIIIGGGYIALEFATFFHELGTKVTVLEKMPRILPMVDEEVSQLLTKIYTEQDITIKTGVDITEIKEGKLKKVTFNRKTITAEQLLISVGRVPNTQELGLEKAGVRTGREGEIIINEELRTSNPNIYAIGDVIGRAMFAHAAKRESKIVLENIINKQHYKMNFKLVPWAIYTNPVIAGIGTNEEKNNGVLKASFRRAGRARIIGEEEGFVKVIYNKKNKHILGCTIIGPRADDLIHEFIAVMNSGTPTIDVIKRIIHVHPTISEVNDTLN